MVAAALQSPSDRGSARGAPAAADPGGFRLLVRSGDPAPAAARLRGPFHCGPAATARGLAVVDGANMTVLLRDDFALLPVAHAGQDAAGGARFASFGCPVTGLDGGLTVPVLLADGRDAIYRLEPDGVPPRELFATGSTVALRSGPATAVFLWGHAADAAGGIVLPVTFVDGSTALLGVGAGGAVEVLAQAGDPLGPGRVAWIGGPRPAVNRGGTVVFTAGLESGDVVLATLRPGEAPISLFLVPPGAPYTLAPQGPAIDDAGTVAFTWFDRGAARLQHIAAGFSQTIVSSGSPVEGGGSVLVLAPVEPILNPAGEVVIGALLADGRGGLLAAAPGRLRAIVLEGEEAAGAGPLVSIPLALPPAVVPGGGVLCAARTETTAGFLVAGDGEPAFVVAEHDRIDAPARFATFLEPRTQFYGAGPVPAPGGPLIFDARVTGGARGLFARGRDGSLAPIALGGDPAPGGGAYRDDVFSFHSINGDGTYAFLASSEREGAPTIALFYGRAGGSPLKVADLGDLVAPGPASSGPSYLPVPPPSRVNAAGQIAFTFRSADGSDVLACYDGSALVFVAAPGDATAAGDRLTAVFTGSFFLGTPIAPHLDDAGNVLFGARTDGGNVALFRGRCGPGGGPVERVFGAADEVEGGRLSPFELQALDADAAGRIAFEAIYSDEFDFAVFLRDADGIRSAGRRFDLVPEIGFLFSVTPRLALVGDGRVAFGAIPFAGPEALLLADPAAGSDTVLLAGRGTEAPDGGRFLDFHPGAAIGGATSRTTARLSADGRGRLAFAATTTAGPQGIFLYGAAANAPPVADAGPPQTVECAGPDGTEVLLDGRGSSDPDGDPLTWLWTGPFGEAAGPQPAVRLPPGVHRIRLVVRDGELESEPAEVVVEVRDTLPPGLALQASPAILWPPDGRLVEIGLAVEVADLCDPAPRLLLLSVTASDPEAPGPPGPLVVDAELGTDDRSFSVRAARPGTAGSRIYTITYGAADASDNATMAAATVAVPHDVRR
jgi:hypothetical protein